MDRLTAALLLLIMFPLTAFSAEDKIPLSDNEKVMLKSLYEYDLNRHIDSGKSMFSWTAIVSSAEQIAADYDANEARGDKHYKNKAIVITGAVEKIRSGIGSIPTVELKGGSEGNDVSLNFSKEYEGLAIDLNKGDLVSYACAGEGSIMGHPVLRDCMPVNAYIDAVSESSYKDTIALLKGKNGNDEESANIILFSKMITKLTEEYRLCVPSDSKCIVNIINDTPMKKRKQMASKMALELGLDINVKP
ncbi:TPA: hypothetical protein ACP4UQ_000753 [Escherichia coli]